MALTKYDADGLHYWAPIKKLGGGWIAFKSSPSAPAAPDPTVTAAAQTKSNIDTANANANINRTNQVSPWGTLDYSHGDTANPDGTYNWTATTKLSPEQQQLLNSSNGISQSLADLGQTQVNNVANTVTKPLDFSKLTNVYQNPLVSNVANNPRFKTNVDGGQIQSGVANAGKINGTVADAGSIQRGIDTSGVGQYQNQANYGKIQDNLDTSNVPGLVGGNQLYAAMQQAQDAAYKQQQSRLDPQYQQQQHNLENQLTQQGVMQNSDAWNKATESFGRTRNDAYQTAYNNAVNNGNAAEAQLYGQGLASNQNAYSQALNTGNFANSAQAQGFGQSLSNANLNNSVVNSQFAQAQAQQQAINAAQQQQYGQNLSNSQFGNAAQGQQYTQNANDMTQANAAQNQTYSQGMQNAGLFNTAAQQNFGNDVTNAQLNNQAAGQDFAQSSALRNQNLNELMTQQQNPLNVLNALRTGSQVTAPTFGSTPQSNVAGTDISGLTQQNFNNQMGAYNSQIQQNNGLTGGLFGIGSALAGSSAGSAALAKMF